MMRGERLRRRALIRNALMQGKSYLSIQCELNVSPNVIADEAKKLKQGLVLCPVCASVLFKKTSIQQSSEKDSNYAKC